MKPSDNYPLRYKQPDPFTLTRSLNGSQETVLFVPESHLRVWYNVQLEGYANHYHGALEIIVCVQQQYRIAANNQIYTLHAGDILIIPPYMLHELFGSPGARFIFLIDISMLECFQDFKALGPIFMEPFLCTPSSHHSGIYEYTYNTLMQMVEIYFSHNLFWETSIYSLLLNVLLSIGRRYFYNADDTPHPSGDKRQDYYELFANLLNFIDAHYADDLTLEQAADYIGFSKYHFARLFKQHTHTTYHNYLCRKRIQAAQFLLTKDGELTVTDIAFRVGFNSLATFCRCFAKYASCSPTEYRNMHKDELMQQPPNSQ